MIRTHAGTIPALIEDRIWRTPDQLCLSGPDGDLSYRQVDELTTAVARRLADAGVEPGEIVAVDAPRSTLGVCLALAVWRAGAGFLLFDQMQPELRRQELLKDARVRIRLGVEDGVPALTVLRNHSPVRVDDLAYVVYTSGSTGTPKGVLCRHASLPPIVEMAIEGFGLLDTDRVAMLAPFHVEGVVFELLAALAIGGSLHIPSVEERQSAADLTKFLRTQEVTVLVGTPTRLGDLDPALLPALRVVISAGEDLPLELAQRWADGRRLINSYGVSEATIASTFTIVPADVRRVSIGRPIAHNSVLLLDADGQPVPTGVPGELFLGGAGVAAAYLNRPELTAERFVEVDGARMYRTGDFAVLEEDDLLYFVGRQDAQVQLGGFRVEPGEVRAMLHTHPAVHDCAVIARDERLIAYVVPQGRVVPAELRDWLAERLPVYLVPSRYLVLDELPRTAWGKVDLQALPEPAPLSTGPTGGTAVQTALAAAVGELLGVVALGIDQYDEDLFLLGLTSILVARLIRRAEAEFDVQLSPVDVFEHPTVAELAEVVEQLRAAP
ncbi:amino acid adenylation domain-containing protein [Kribbella antibiotica]|uniref:Amino acid adenylation domain-containing protein n=1 Tax=Kribbella antibiotica TaxID=190195 RepID=A0A4R4ZL24_9ACTN|nr:non-ribosomal peptide synthetase [Kribbella antibiotica]TDD59255.1 amino acid adenylation domain-containing protein [Kribbella antibiotica]